MSGLDGTDPNGMGAVDGEPTGDKSDIDDEKVTLSSIHQAKGLEWKVVFLIWLVDGQFPNGRILEDFPPEWVEEWQVGNADPWNEDEPF